MKMLITPMCSAAENVTFNDVTRTAREWASQRGLCWETAKKRRQRGASWEEALRPGLRRTSFNAFIGQKLLSRPNVQHAS